MNFRTKYENKCVYILKKIKTSLLSLSRYFRRIIFISIVKAFPWLFKYLVFSNDSTAKKDGTGAQIQRMLSVASLASYLGCNFIQSRIMDVAVHPLDPFQEKNLYEKFLIQLNSGFELLETANEFTIVELRKIDKLEIIELLGFAIKSYRKKSKLRLVVQDPYAVSDLVVEAYANVIPKLRISKKIALSANGSYVAIHYRQGVGNFVIYPGQSIPREIDISHFKKLIEEHANFEPHEKKVVHIFTDAPPKILKFSPPNDQNYLWEGMPGFENGVMTIQPLDFSASSLGVDEIVIHSGGDPLEAIEKMAKARVLILGRSSLSYVAGLLNIDGKVVAPPNFWHPNLKTWIS